MDNLLEFKYTNLSQDYELLFELMQKERIICFVDNAVGMQDICATMPIIDNSYYRIGARGIEYIGAFDYKELSAKELNKTKKRFRNIKNNLGAKIRNNELIS